MVLLVQVYNKEIIDGCFIETVMCNAFGCIDFKRKQEQLDIYKRQDAFGGTIDLNDIVSITFHSGIKGSYFINVMEQGVSIDELK